MTRTFSPPRHHGDLLQTIVRGLVPFGNVAIEAFETCVRARENVQRVAARGVRFPPAQYALTTSAELTRDLGAAQASWGRWYLGL
jgi:hypothetical protein